MHRLAALLPLALLACSAAHAQPRLVSPEGAFFARGVPTGLAVVGLGPGDSATLVAHRRMVRVVEGRPDTLSMRSWARLAGRRGGRVSVDSVAPVTGSWEGADPFGLFWSMTRADSLTTLAPGRVLLRLEWRGRIVDSLVLASRPARPGIAARWVQGDGFAGSYAAPAAPGRHPALLLLHGSEGGDSVAARALAEAFANQGFASLALTYFSWGGAIPGVPTALVNIPLDMLDAARAWMGAQPGADTSRTGLWGGSKGAELALVTASRRAWVRAVVACAPTDVVWSGFGRAPNEGERYSSWRDGAASFAYVPYDRYDEALNGTVTARAVHDRSRAKWADSARAARIEIERSRAPVLLLTGERDEVWDSTPASRAIAAALAAAGRPAQATVRAFPLAGHGVCGYGATPWPFLERAHPTSTPPDARATARASATAWLESARFLRGSLAAP